MKIEMACFQDHLLRLYTSDPARYTPFALWKMQKMTAEGVAFHLPEYDCYYAIRDQQLLFYTSADQKCHLPVEELNRMDFIVMHPDIFDPLKDRLTGFNLSNGWALFFDFSYRPRPRSASRYEIVDFDFTDEAHFQAAAEIINGDADGGFTPQRLRRWTSFPTFDPTLWIFVREIETQKLISIGISTYHKEARETDLDWIYVLIGYQGQGAGRFLIEEIIRRSACRSSVIRVGGEDEFYKKCGFYEKQRWGFAVKPGFAMNEQ